jgi:hypothetical protein
MPDHSDTQLKRTKMQVGSATEKAAAESAQRGSKNGQTQTFDARGGSLSRQNNDFLLTGFSADSGDIRQMGVTDVQINYNSNARQLAGEIDSGSGQITSGGVSHSLRMSPGLITKANYGMEQINSINEDSEIN